MSIDRRHAIRATAILLVCGLALSSLTATPCNRPSSQKDAWVATKINSLVLAARAAYQNDKAQKAFENLVTEISGTIKECRLEEDRDIVWRYPEFLEYVKTLSISQLSDHELGFVVPDKVYFAETREYVAIPDFLLAPRFLRAVSHFETLNQAKAQLRQMNAAREVGDQLLFFSYKSRHLGTPDNDASFLRLLIVVPGNVSQHVPEKWVQFGIPDPHARASVRNISVVAVTPGSEQTSNVYFKDYFRTYRRDGSISIKGRWELGYGDDNCVQCHKSGILPIFPVRGSVSRDEEHALQTVNERFLTYGPPRFDRYLDASKFGPGLGSKNPPSEPLWSFEHGANDRGVNNSLRCGACHRPNGLGALNWPMDRVVISSFVKGGQMPLGSILNSSERAVLYKKLIEDYFAVDDSHPGILKVWLSGRLP